VRKGEWIWLLVAMCVMLVVATSAGAAAIAQKSFASPEEAADALVRAVKAHDRAATLAVLGDAGEWISSGDSVADRAMVHDVRRRSGRASIARWNHLEAANTAGSLPKTRHLCEGRSHENHRHHHDERPTRTT